MPELLDIVGQDAALAQLQRAVAGKRRPHAYVFAGPEGVGRRTTAVEFAKVLLCPTPRRAPNRGRLSHLPDEFELRVACGQCSSCRTAAAGTNSNLQLVYKELARYHDDHDVRQRVMQDLGIDVIRQFLIEPAYRASADGRGKVFIVRGAELMSIPAQNALLKTLEEPPAGVTIVLVCHGPGDLLPTTRSRCQTIRFSALPTGFVAESLTRAGVSEIEARFWAAFSDGSLGRANALAREGTYEFKRRLVEQLSALSAGKEAALADMLTKAMDSRAKALKQADNQLPATLASRQAGQTLLALTASVYRDALTAASATKRPFVHDDQSEAIRRIAARLGSSALTEILSQLARYEQLLWSNVNPKLLWDNVAMTCATAATLEV